MLTEATAVEKKFPGDKEKLARMSLIEGECSLMQFTDARHDLTICITEGFPKNLRMANLACIGSRKVNGVAEVSSLFTDVPVGIPTEISLVPQ